MVRLSRCHEDLLQLFTHGSDERRSWGVMQGWARRGWNESGVVTSTMMADGAFARIAQPER